jgi:hypothetical protein
MRSCKQLCAAAANAAHVAEGTTSDGLVYKLEPWGTDAVRVRIAAPGMTQVPEPITGALNSTVAPPSRQVRAAVTADPTSVTNGHITASIDPSTGLVTVTRVSDHKVLLDMKSIQWGEQLHVSPCSLHHTPRPRTHSLCASLKLSGTLPCFHPPRRQHARSACMCH